MVTKDRQIRTMVKVVPGRKQENRINTNVGKKIYEMGGILARMILHLLDEASMGNTNEYKTLFLPCYISAE